jgi:hypothetical protein
METRTPYPTDVSDEEWAFVAPYLTLLPEDASQRKYPHPRGIPCSRSPLLPRRPAHAHLHSRLENGRFKAVEKPVEGREGPAMATLPQPLQHRLPQGLALRRQVRGQVGG